MSDKAESVRHREIRRTARRSTCIDGVTFNIATVVVMLRNSEWPKNKLRNTYDTVLYFRLSGQGSLSDRRTATCMAHIYHWHSGTPGRCIVPLQRGTDGLIMNTDDMLTLLTLVAFSLSRTTYFCLKKSYMGNADSVIRQSIVAPEIVVARAVTSVLHS